VSAGPTKDLLSRGEDTSDAYTARVGAKPQLPPIAGFPIAVSLDHRSLTLAMIQALTPFGLRAVEDTLQQQVPRARR